MMPFLLKRLSIMIGLLFFAGLSHAEAEIADAGPQSSKSPIRWRGYITPKFGYFDNSGNPAYLNRIGALLPHKAFAQMSQVAQRSIAT